MSTTPIMTITEPDADSIETWQNVTRGRVVINRIGAMGAKRPDMIGAGKTFHVTPLERRINQEAAANPDLDVFLNGTLQPVHLPQGNGEDYTAITENPNLLGDDKQVARLFKANDDVFAERLGEIKNASALERLKDLANQDATGARVSQLRMIEARITQVAPVIENIHPDATGPDGKDRGTIKAVTPK
jgi:hypothetical protein